MTKKVAQAGYKTIAYTFVMADLLHYGHIKLLKTAKENADYHVCGLVSDEACHLWQGISVCNFEERKAVLECLDCVDEVVKQESMDPTDNLKALKERFPDAGLVVVHGDDWKTLPAREYIESIGAKIIQPEYYAQLSRDAIVNKFKSETRHPLKHEFFTHHFRVGDIRQFASGMRHPLVSTKANTLNNFKTLLKRSSIEKIFVCTVDDFADYREKIIDAVQEEFRGAVLIVRSSSVNEDTSTFSNAGRFESVGSVDSSSRESIAAAIEVVIGSYKKAGPLRPGEQVLVQSQTTEIKKSGVVFTRNLETNTPYYMINYDDESGKTDTVTGGEIGKSTWLYREPKVSAYPPQWRALLGAVQEIESHLPGMILDIEFAEKKDGAIIIFQIRPLSANIRCAELDDDRAFASVLEDNIERYRISQDKMDSEEAFLSDMAFWNPSEIIGDTPHPLDYSLYREIITKSAWNEGITPLGYTKVEHELMVRYGTKPYIDLSYSFYALTPEELSPGLKKRLVSFYKSKLRKDLTAHDKIEFETVLSCWDFETIDRCRELREAGFSAKEVGKVCGALKRLTLGVIKGYEKRLVTDASSLKQLREAVNTAANSAKKNTDPYSCIQASLELIKRIQRSGTPPFARIARQAFIANSLCKSLVKKGLITDTRINAFMESISTVATEFDIDFQKYVAGLMSRKRFLERYGHLRAGTYDIIAPRYDKMELFDEKHSKKGSHHFKAAKKTSLPALDMNQLDEILNGSELKGVDAAELVFFLKSSIEERERFKFEFTKALSLALELLAEGGSKLGFSREDMAYLDLSEIKSFQFYGMRHELSEYWRFLSVSRRRFYGDASKLILPPVIDSADSFKVINSWISRPNFITSKTVFGEAVNLDSDPAADVTGRIVLMKKADPGFDWIFTKKIKGLITKYGGAASHMAIRCAEFNIPAAIGCGEKIFSAASSCRELELNCGDRKIRLSAGIARQCHA